MTFPTSAEIKAKLGGLVRAHWPIIIILIFTYCGGVERRDYMGRVVQAIGAAGIVVVLPIFKLQKNIFISCLKLFMRAETTRINNCFNYYKIIL